MTAKALKGLGQFEAAISAFKQYQRCVQLGDRLDIFVHMHPGRGVHAWSHHGLVYEWVVSECDVTNSFPSVKKNKKIFKKVNLEIRTLEKQNKLQNVGCEICYSHAHL